jgi:hypothetical protein
MVFHPSTLSLEDLASHTGNAQPGSLNHTAGMAEFTFRQTKAQLEASEAQIIASHAETKAAEAAVKGTAAAERNAKYMLASVVVAAIAAIASAVSTLATVHPAWFK